MAKSPNKVRLETNKQIWMHITRNSIADYMKEGTLWLPNIQSQTIKSFTSFYRVSANEKPASMHQWIWYKLNGTVYIPIILVSFMQNKEPDNSQCQEHTKTKSRVYAICDEPQGLLTLWNMKVTWFKTMESNQNQNYSGAPEKKNLILAHLW